MERIMWLIKKGFLLPTRRVILSLTSRIRPKITTNTGGKRKGLVKLHKEIEKCSGYRDIQVMWDLIHSSCPPTTDHNKKNSGEFVASKPV